MDSRTNESFDELPTVETPEDVAVLYSWANLHGAKYRDFSASRREYRAQLRHRAAEQVRETELRAQADAQTAAYVAEDYLRQAENTVRTERPRDGEGARLQALQEAERAAQIAAAERIEAARRAEAAAQAEALARREEREMAEASASARRQAAVYAEESRRRTHSSSEELEVPGEISDPYTPQSRPAQSDSLSMALSEPSSIDHYERRRQERESVREAPSSPAPAAAPTPVPAPAPVPQPTRDDAPLQQFAPQIVSPAAPRRPRGYRPDDASGVRQIYRGPDSEIRPPAKLPVSAPPSTGGTRTWAENPVPPYATRETTLPQIQAASEPSHPEAPRNWTPGPTRQPQTALHPPQAVWAGPEADRAPMLRKPAQPAAAPSSGRPPVQQPVQQKAAPAQTTHRDDPEAAGQLEDPTPKRRRQDMPGYRATDSDRAIAAYRREQGQPLPYANVSQRAASESSRQSKAEPPSRPQQRTTDPVGPAWIYASQSGQPVANVSESAPAPAQSQPAPATSEPSVSDTLQRSRERVASRWYALKGVFEQPGQDRAEKEPVRQKETRTPVLAVFSLAGGVGKTSLVATLGRSLSSLGEKVLLTDTTSHGLLPFYFGASELRQGTVRTFSPPSGSTDAPIYLVNYAVDQAAGDEDSQETVIEEMANSSRGTHRMLLDLTASTGWVIRRMARLSPTVLVPLAPDMNSVISLQAIEKFFHGVTGPDGAALKIFYVLNQFDAALPLHLDVREVLRRQLGERLLPFVIRRAPAVSEALAEGMTIVDYAPDQPVAEDYMTIATWLRTQSAPATAGFRNVRWSER